MCLWKGQNPQSLVSYHTLHETMRQDLVTYCSFDILWLSLQMAREQQVGRAVPLTCGIFSASSCSPLLMLGMWSSAVTQPVAKLHAEDVGVYKRLVLTSFKSGWLNLIYYDFPVISHDLLKPSSKPKDTQQSFDVNCSDMQSSEFKQTVIQNHNIGLYYTYWTNETQHACPVKNVSHRSEFSHFRLLE